MEIFLAGRDGDVDVVVANREEAIGDQDEVRGDFERDLRKFFKLSGQSDDKSDSDAHMIECADLAEHGVPDTACRRTLVGESVLKRMTEVLRESGLQLRLEWL